MTINFQHIPSNIRVPLFYAEVDNSQANTARVNQRTLIIGQVTNSGSAVVNVPVISQGVADAIAVGGQGSMLALMTAAYRDNDAFGEVWYLPLADDGGATSASGAVKFTSVATAAGTLSLYIGGTRISQPVLTTQTTAQLATALAALVNATPNLPVTAAVDGLDNTKVNLTARNAGACGNDIDIRLNYLGTAGGESTPTGLAVTLTAMSGGATNPSLTTALANCGDQLFDFIVCPYNDTTSLNALKSFLDDSTGRWSWSRKLYGHFFAAYRGTLGASTTFGTARNDPHGTVMAFNDSPTPYWLAAAQLTGAVAPSLRNDPALPVHTLEIKGFMAPPLQSRFSLSERNTLLFDGISTFTVGDDGTVRVEGLITTYQKNAFNQPDDSLLKVNDLFNIAYCLRFLETRITSKYARVKLASDETRTSDPTVVKPSTIRAELIAGYMELEDEGKVQNSKAFAQALQVEKSGVGRVNVLYPAELIEQLDIFALLFQLRRN